MPVLKKRKFVKISLVILYFVCKISSYVSKFSFDMESS